MRQRRIMFAALLMGLMSAGCGPKEPAYYPGEKPSVEISNARIRAPLKGAPAAAGFMEIQALGTDDALTGASSPVARRVEIHIMSMDENNVMRMRQVNKLALPAGETVALAPGGTHLMLFDLELVDEQEDVLLNLTFASGKTLPIVADVIRPDTP